MPKRKYKNNRERLLEVGPARTNAVIERIRILGNCSNRYLYDYREDEVNKMFRAIQRALDDARARFKTQRKKKREKFNL